MSRIGEFDLCDRLSPGTPVWVTQVGVALACCGLAGIVRRLCDLAFGEVAPFALIYPAMMLATLFGRAAAEMVRASRDPSK